jgi:hypothetical protein
MLVLVMLVPQANAKFTKTPIFDLRTSSSLAGATDALYTLHIENRDQSEDATSLSITVPAGYSIDQKFITNKAGIKAMSAYGSCADWSGQASVVTTTTPGRLLMAAMGTTVVEITVSEPTSTTQGIIEMTFVGIYTIMNRGCHGDITPVKGFFINPSTPGTYAWAPSIANPKSGPSATMEARSGFSQTVTIVGTGATTSVTTTETQSPGTTQTATSTSVQVTTSTPAQTTAAQTTIRTTPSETETPTTTQAPPTGQLPTELLAAAVAVIVIIAAGAILVLRRKK